MSDTTTIRYRGRDYGEADMAALLQALNERGVVRVQNDGVAWWSQVADGFGRSNATPWAALCAAVRAAGLEDKT